MAPVLTAENVSKRFSLHTQGSIVLPVLEGVSLSLAGGECIALKGPSGSGKSTFLRMIYGNYTCPEGRIRVRHDGGWLDVATAGPRTILELRRRTIGYVSQFLRIIPRISTVDIVAEPLRARGAEPEEAVERAKTLLARLNVPERLWPLSPLTFSGGEQQRVNIARCFIADYPILLLDEPTASLDQESRRIVLDLIEEAKARDAGVIGIFHDLQAREAVCTRTFDISRHSALEHA